MRHWHRLDARFADPVGSELRRTLDQVQIGVPMIDALQQTSNRVRVADFRFLVVALSMQQKTGGSLAETLANLRMPHPYAFSADGWEVDPGLTTSS